MRIIIDFMGSHFEASGGYAFIVTAFIGSVIVGFILFCLELFKVV